MWLCSLSLVADRIQQKCLVAILTVIHFGSPRRENSYSTEMTIHLIIMIKQWKMHDKGNSTQIRFILEMIFVTFSFNTLKLTSRAKDYLNYLENLFVVSAQLQIVILLLRINLHFEPNLASVFSWRECIGIRLNHS